MRKKEVALSRPGIIYSIVSWEIFKIAQMILYHLEYFFIFQIPINMSHFCIPGFMASLLFIEKFTLLLYPCRRDAKNLLTIFILTDDKKNKI